MIELSFAAFGGVSGHVPVRRPAWPSTQSLRTVIGPQTRMPRDQKALRALRRPQEGMGAAGGGIRGVGSGRLGTLPNGASDQGHVYTTGTREPAGGRARGATQAKVLTVWWVFRVEEVVWD
jgi:hypothetical protein